MDLEATQKLKEELGYVDRAPTCDTCRFFQGRRKGDEAGWFPVCTVSSVGEFLVTPEGLCRRFEHKA